MNRTHLLPAVALLASALACGAENRGQVALTNLCFPPEPEAGKACSYPATCEANLANGRLWVDVAISPGRTLWYPIELRNDRPAVENDFVGDVGTAFVKSFEMRYEGAGPAVTSGNTRQSITVPSNGATVAVVELIPPEVGAAIAASFPRAETRINIRVRGHGEYQDGKAFTTPWYDVPVGVYNGAATPFACAPGQTMAGPCPQDGQTAAASCE